ncbi:MAG: PAS domain S-box protein [Pseudomonas sp.]
MKMRLLASQAYLLIFGCGLVLLGLFVAADYLLSDTLSLFTTQSTVDRLMLAVLTMGLPLALIVVIWLQRPASVAPTVLDRPGLLIAASSAVVATLTWYLLYQVEVRDLNARSDLVLGGVEQQLDTTLSERLNTLQRMGERLELQGPSLDEQVWQLETGSYLRDYPDLLFITLMDRNLNTVRVSHRQQSAAPMLQTLLDSTPKDLLWHDHAERNQAHHRAFLGGQSDNHTLLVMPLSMSGQDLLLLAALDLQGILNAAFGIQSSMLELRISRSGQQIFGPQASDKLLTVNSRSLEFAHDDAWQIETLIPRYMLAEPGSQLSGWLFTLILFIGYLLLISQRLAIERDRDRQQLRTSEQRYRSLFSANPDAVFAFDMNGMFTSMNAATDQLTGRTEAQLLGLKFTDLVHQDDLERVVSSFERACQGESQRYELRIWNSANEILELDVTNLPIRIDNKVVGVFGIAKDVRPYNAARRALRERNQFFHLSREMFCMVDLAGHFVQINPAFLQVLGYQLEELLGKPYAALINPRDRSLVKDAVGRLAAGELVESLSLRVTRRDGTERVLSINSSMGEDQLIYVAARDITQQRAVDLELQRQRSLLEIAGSLARIGGWIANIETGEVILSDEICAIHKMPPGSALLLNKVLDLYLPEWHQVMRDNLLRCIKHGSAYQLRCEALTITGERIWVQLMARPLRDDQGQITHIQGALQDISEVVKAEEQLRRLASSMKVILESITDAFFAVDRDWRFVYVNPRAEMTLQRRSDQLLGNNVWECFPEARGTLAWTEYHEAVAQGQSRHFELYYPPLQVWLEVSAFPSDEGLSVYFRDITKRKQDEQQLRDTLAELERSNSELQDFAFIASHDLQEPLRKVQAFGERLEKRADTLDDTSRDYLQRMRQAAERMQSLIQGLLVYSRVSTQGEPLKPVDLDQVLDEVLQDIETCIENTSATVQRSPLKTVLGDARQLGQVLQNLLSNALKFQQSGNVPLIQIYGRADSNGAWTLCVADNGIGFDEKYLDRIFDPFQRLHDRQQYRGTGIGLAIVRKIVQRHGAAITAHSQPGQGATFEITFRRLNHPLEPQLAVATSFSDTRKELKP